VRSSLRSLHGVVLFSMAWLILTALLAGKSSAQSGMDRGRWKDIARRVGRVMEKGSRSERIARVEELVKEAHPLSVRIIARGIATSHKRSRNMEKKISTAHARNAELYKRLKIQPIQRKGDRTRNDEINENLDLVERLQELNKEERTFRRETLTLVKKMVLTLDNEKRKVMAGDLLGEMKLARDNYKSALVDVVGRIPLPVTIAATLDVARLEKDPLLRLTAIDALGDCGEEEAAEGLIPFLKDPRWQIRVAAVEALRKLRKKVAIPALIEAMGREEGRVREDVLAALQAMTGIDKADNPAVWRNWWNENKDKTLVARGAKPDRPHHPLAGKGRRSRKARPGQGDDWRNRQAGGAGRTSFYGIQTKSKHIVYILDHSGSMQGPASTGRTTGNDGTAGLTKIEVAKRELWKSVQSLAPDATFNVLFYNHAFTVFHKGMARATAANKRAVKEYIDGINADSSTNIYDTLERAFQIGGQGAVDKAYKVNFDTIFFLTDGSPTSGKTTDWKEILAEVDRWNKTKRIKVHCVGIGPHNQAFLSQLARKTGGEYTTRG
jgi:HEAT repeat protein/VWA domain-containing protein